MNPKTLAVLDFDKVRRQLADHTTFSAGRALAMALAPSTDPATVHLGQARTREARDYQDRRGGAELGGAHDMRAQIEAALRGKALIPQELLDIRDTVTAARRMRRALSRDRGRWPALAELSERLEPCPALYDAIQATLDDNGDVLDSASPALRRIRRELRVARERVMRQLEGMVSQGAVREHLQEALITQRSGRFVLPVKSEFRSRVPGVVHDTSDSGATVFIEPLSIIEPGNTLRHLELEEEKEVDRVLRALSGFVAAEADALNDSIAALAELDLAYACGEYAHQLHAVEPQLVEGTRKVREQQVVEQASVPLGQAMVLPSQAWDQSDPASAAPGQSPDQLEQVSQPSDRSPGRPDVVGVGQPKAPRRSRDPGRMREEPIPPLLDFPRARHPLLDPATVVPVDVRVGEDFRLLVITGPNTGGKTVTLKTVGLLVLMAQSGLQIPAAEGARLTVLDGVFADIGDEQSIEQSLSTFSGHMTNIIGILSTATDRSLVLLDELGAGTDPVEGAALAKALLEHLRARAITTVASTHYSELKVYAHNTSGVANASVEFDVESLRPTYELTIGLPGRSNALAIAGRLGLPAPIVEAARGELDTGSVDLEVMLTEIRDARRRAQSDRDAAADGRRQAETWAAKLETAVHEVEKERTSILNTARRQAAGELAAAHEAIGVLERRAEKAATAAQAAATAAITAPATSGAGGGARYAPHSGAGAPYPSGTPGAEAAVAAGAAAEVAAARREIERLTGIVVPEPEAPTPLPAGLEALRPGHQVRVISFNGTGEVVRLHGDEAEIQLGRLRLNVPLTDLEFLPQTQTQAPPPPPTATRVNRAPEARADVGIELDLRGMRVEEGLDEMERHLDDALLAGMPWVRIIHGHGTGAMRQAVRDALRHHPAVDRSRPGEKGEGGDGVTVAYMVD